jgi:hypothetical protein
MLSPMSDLQCPACIVLLTPESSAGSTLDRQRLARVIVATGLPADASLAHAHGLELERARLDDGPALREHVAHLADLHRGECVAIIVSARALCEALALVEAPAEPVMLVVDSDGMRIQRA